MNTFLKNSVPVVFRDLLSSHTIFYFRTNRCWKEHAINHTYIQNRIYYPSFHNRDWARWLIPVSQFATCCGFSLICITLTGGSVCVADTTCLSVTASVPKASGSDCTTFLDISVCTLCAHRGLWEILPFFLLKVGCAELVIISRLRHLTKLMLAVRCTCCAQTTLRLSCIYLWQKFQDDPTWVFLSLLFPRVIKPVAQFKSVLVSSLYPTIMMLWSNYHLDLLTELYCWGAKSAQRYNLNSSHCGVELQAF